jgi:serine/threonine protein kinase
MAPGTGPGGPLAKEARVRSGAAATALAAGTRLAGRYLLLDRLGSGGMGVVWQARDELLDRDVAIKDLWLPATVTSAERAQLRDRVLGEARVAARFSHPGAVVLHDVLVHDGRPLLVMELVDTPSLYELVEQEGPLPPGLVARLGMGLLDTLEAAHRQGVVHLDVTPANVLVLADGGTKLADFGIAAAQDAPARDGGTVFGSPAYMAPEQVAGERVGPAADLWALAATLYFAVEGVPPFGQGEPAETLAAVTADPPRPPRLAGPLGPALLGVLDKQPALRPGAVRLRQQLGPLAADDAAGRRAEAAPPAKGAWAPAGATLRLPGSPPATTRQRPAAAPWPGPPVGAWVVMAAALVALLGLVAALDRGPGPRPLADATSRPPARAITSTGPARPAAVAPQGGSLEVRHRPESVAADDNSIRPAFQIVNRGGRDVPLRELTLRYWYTVDRWRPQQVWCDWAPFGNAAVLGRAVRLARPANGADSYLELRFADGAGQIAAGRSSGEIKTRLNKDDWSPFDQHDDWSWTPATGRYAAAPKVTLYRNGRLVWGREPPRA